MAIFNSKLLVYQRVNWKYPLSGPLDKYLSDRIWTADAPRLVRVLRVCKPCSISEINWYYPLLWLLSYKNYGIFTGIIIDFYQLIISTNMIIPLLTIIIHYYPLLSHYYPLLSTTIAHEYCNVHGDVHQPNEWAAQVSWHGWKFQQWAR